MNQLYRAVHMPIGRLIKKIMGHKEKYVICIRKIQKNDDILTVNSPMDFEILFHDKSCWFADPILQEYCGKTALFMEQFDLKTNCGMIACSILQDNVFHKPIPVIKEPFHMSFPLTFIWNGELYMIPETSADNSVRLYKVVKYPFKWELVKRFETKIPLVDSVVLKVCSDKLIILASEPDQKNGLQVKFVKYFICINNGEFVIKYDEEYNCKQKFNFKNRNAGKMFMSGKSLVLPTQESTKTDYGFCLNFQSISFYNDTDFWLKVPMKQVAPIDINVVGMKLKDEIGVHTYAKSETYEIIDLRYLD